MLQKENYFGEFNGSGYCIYTKDVKYGYMLDVYRAGNCKFDSAQTLPPYAEGALDIATIEDYCNQTGKEIAAEKGGNWCGSGKIEDYED